MIVQPTIGAQVRVDRASLANPNAREWVSGEVRRSIVSEGERFGYSIRLHSVHFEKDVDRPDTNQCEIRAVWCPDPSEGAEFRGGAFDGDVKPMPPDQDGRPPEYFNLTIVIEPSVVMEADQIYPTIPLDNIARYRLAGVDPVFDRWVYEVI